MAPPSLQAGRDAAQAGRYDAARRAFEAAADLGDPEGFYELGLLHKRGQGVRKSEGAALAMFQVAAEAGCAAAQYELALCLFAEDGVAAERWLSQAAKAEHAPAMTRLAALCGERDPEAARELLARAAHRGHRPAMIGYGYVLAGGLGGPLDRVEGVAWLRAAASLARDPELEGDIETLTSVLAQREIDAAHKKARMYAQGQSSAIGTPIVPRGKPEIPTPTTSPTRLSDEGGSSPASPTVADPGQSNKRIGC